MIVRIFSLFIFFSPSWVFGASVGQEAPHFSLPELDHSRTVSLVDYRGKVVYLDFWASWCLPCRKSMPALESLRERFNNEDFKILAVNIDSDLEKAKRFEKLFDLSYPLLAGGDHDIKAIYKVEVLPKAFIIDSEGVIRAIHDGFNRNHINFLEAHIQKYLAETN